MDFYFHSAARIHGTVFTDDSDAIVEEFSSETSRL